MNIAIILAGGTGSRVGSDIPKQFIEISGRMMIMYSMDPFRELEIIDGIQIVADKLWRDSLTQEMRAKGNGVEAKFIGFSEPGANRQLSIYNALLDVKEKALGGAVIIHDAARPFVTKKCIEECFSALSDHDGAMPVLPMNDTVYYSSSGKQIERLLDRSAIFAGQAPEAFIFDKYYDANKALLPDKILMIRGSTEVAVMAGMDVAMITGDPGNFKVTNKEDLVRARQLLGCDNF